MNWIDTHCHLFLEEFTEDREAVILRAMESGITHFLLPNVDLSTIKPLHDLCNQYPYQATPMMGLHPTSVDDSYHHALEQIESCLGKRKYCAIGEIGLDMYWDKTWIKEQKEVFEKQLRWSIEWDLPVCIHTRDAFPEVFEVIRKVGPEKLRGVFHSFTGTKEDVAQILSFGEFLIGINGVVTFKNSGVADVIKHIDPTKIILETDAPYLAPVPYRGKRNEPIYMIRTAEKLAETLNLNLLELAEITTNNARKLFSIRD